jgi:hypothetical protein
MQDPGPSCSERCAKDWAGDAPTLTTIWGLPGAALLASSLTPPGVRAVVWTASLIWLGVACLANARRCGRTHCRFTGPFFLLMAAGVVAYVFGALPLGENGWAWIGATAVIGNALLWWGSENLYGRFRDTR